jgi:hypothetical protein
VLQTTQQVGGSVGVATLVAAFGAASRSAAVPTLAGAAPPPAHVILALGTSHAFSIGTIFAAGALLVVLLAIHAAPAGASGEPDELPAGI